MVFYNEDRKKIIIPDNVLNNIINNGTCATVYRYTDDLCFKYYDRGIDYEYCLLNPSIKEDLGKIDSPNLVNIKEILFKDNNKYKVDAYLLPYYEEKYQELLELPTDYLLYNMEEILKLTKKISEYKIRVDDLKRKNMILTDNNIVLIDPDRWYYERSINENEIKKTNINNIMQLFNKVIRDELDNNYKEFLLENRMYSSTISDKLFPLVSNDKKAMKVLTKRLNGYKKPIDYVYSKKK